MKLVIQRVKSAKVTKVETNEVVGEIGKGLLVLLGIKKGDTTEMVTTLAQKLSKMRIMADENDKMNLSVTDLDAQILLVSQFTLYANTKDGNRPSFIEAEEPEKARKLYEYFINELKRKGIKVQIGSFGDYMQINADIDGPVTIVVE